MSGPWPGTAYLPPLPPGSTYANTSSNTAPPTPQPYTTSGIPGPPGPQGPPGPAQAAGYTASSSTSLPIATGAISLTTESNLAYTAGARIRLSSTGSGAYQEGVVTAYNIGTGALQATIDHLSGSGTHADWNINLAGDVGSTGPTGPQGPVGPDNVNWVPYTVGGQSFQKDDLTRDGAWTMIANAATTDRPAPQPSGSEEDLLPPWVPATQNARASYTLYNEWTLSAAGWLSQYGTDILTGNLGMAHAVSLSVNGTVVSNFTITPSTAGRYNHDIPPIVVASGAVVRVTVGVTQTANNQVYWYQQTGLFATAPTYCSLAQGSKDGGAAGTTAYGCHAVFTPGTASPNWDIVAYSGAVVGGGGAPGPSVTISDTAPTSPNPGDLWWNSSDGNLYIYYQDPNSSQWVVANPAAAGQFLPLTGGTVSGSLTVTGSLTAHQQQGVTDGSNAAAGQVGEYLSATNAGAVTIPNGAWTTIVSLALTAGDWDIWGAANVGGVGGTLSTAYAGIVTTNNGAPSNNQQVSSVVLGGTLGGIGLSGVSLAPPLYRASISAPATFYLVAYAQWNTATSGSGSANNSMIAARRVR